MIVYRCDRCGREINPNDPLIKEYNSTNSIYMIDRRDPVNTCTTTHIDLCPNCSYDLGKFIESIKYRVVPIDSEWGNG